MEDHPAVRKYAHSFAAITGLELDDLLQEARIACWNAEVGAIGSIKYDPRKASINTFITWCVYRHLCGIAERHKRTYQISNELNEAIPDQHTPLPDKNLLLAELIRELPDDARIAVNLVLGDVDAIVGLTTRKARGYIRQTLGWSPSRARAAFLTVNEMLSML
jgi:DNA-directed RNA polymerase specialized sigma24 family protein